MADSKDNKPSKSNLASEPITSDPVVDTSVDWQEQTIRAVFFCTGDLLTKDTVITINLCRDALETLGYRSSLVLETSHLPLTIFEGKLFFDMFQTVVRRLYEDRYGAYRLNLT